MKKEKFDKLTVYAQSLKNRLVDPTPVKHIEHPETYKQFLNRELKAVMSQLEEAKMEGTK